MSSTTIVLIFQSTLPHGSDRWYSILNISHLLFQSTLPHGSDLGMSARLSTTPNFNPRSLTGATRCMTLTLLSVAFQSTLPHGSEQPSLADQTFAEISIHAPLRERLKLNVKLKKKQNISIHAPLRERPCRFNLSARH